MADASEIIVAIAKMFGKGRIQIPKEVRSLLELNDGDSICFAQNSYEQVIIKKIPKLKQAKLGRYK